MSAPQLVVLIRVYHLVVLARVNQSGLFCLERSYILYITIFKLCYVYASAVQFPIQRISGFVTLTKCFDIFMSFKLCYVYASAVKFLLSTIFSLCYVDASDLIPT